MERSCSGLGTSTGGPCAQGKGETPSLPLKTLLRHLSLADISSPSQLEPQNPLLGGPPHAATGLLFCCHAGLWPPDGDLHPQRLLSIAGLPLPKCLPLSPGSASRLPIAATCPREQGLVWDYGKPHTCGISSSPMGFIRTCSSHPCTPNSPQQPLTGTARGLRAAEIPKLLGRFHTQAGVWGMLSCCPLGS